MAQKIYTGIDIGTYHVKVIIATRAASSELPMQILGTGTASSRGLRQGYIVDVKEAAKSVRGALQRASSAARIRIGHARVAVGGISLDEVTKELEKAGVQLFCDSYNKLIGAIRAKRNA